MVVGECRSVRYSIYTMPHIPMMYSGAYNLDTIGPNESVLIREMSLFQGLKGTQARYLRKNLFRVCPNFKCALI